VAAYTHVQIDVQNFNLQSTVARNVMSR